MHIDNELLTQWEPKVQSFLSKTYIRGLDRADIAQELRIAIMKAAKGFNEDRGVLFHTYLHTTMVNTINQRNALYYTPNKKDLWEEYAYPCGLMAKSFFNGK